MFNVTLVASDLKALSAVRTRLESKNLEVRGYTNIHEAAAALKRTESDIALIDIHDGEFESQGQLAEVQTVSNVPVILLGNGDDEIQELVGLRMGVDDFVANTCSNRILVERLRHAAALHKKYGEPADIAPSDYTLTRGDLEISFQNWMARWRNEPIALTVREMKILYALARNPEHVKSRAQIMDEVYDDNVYVDDRNVDSHIKRIRNKIRAIDPEFDCIQAVYGVGYKYTDELSDVSTVPPHTATHWGLSATH